MACVYRVTTMVFAPRVLQNRKYNLFFFYLALGFSTFTTSINILSDSFLARNPWFREASNRFIHGLGNLALPDRSGICVPLYYWAKENARHTQRMIMTTMYPRLKNGILAMVAAGYGGGQVEEEEPGNNIYYIILFLLLYNKLN